MAEAKISKSYNPGDLIYTNEPFAYVLSTALRDHHCDYCLKSLSSKRIRCFRCSLVNYCSGMCQKKARWEHKRECKSLKNLPKGNLGFIRLLGKVVLKLQLKNGDAYSDMIGSEKRTFNDLTHVKQGSSAEKEDLLILKYTSELRKYLGDQILLDDANLHDVVLKVKQNFFWIQNYVRSAGYGVYIGASAIRHACIPNAMCTFKGTKVEIRAIKTLPKEEQLKNVTVSYCPLIDGYYDTEFGHLVMQSEYDAFLKRCKCRDCSLPSHKSVLRKILKKEAAFEAVTKTEEFLFREKNSNLNVREINIIINSCLKLHRDVLADTHILHLIILARHVVLISHMPSTAVSIIPDVIDCMSKAFGEHSPLIVPFYDVLHFSYIHLGMYPEAQENLNKFKALCKLHGDDEHCTIMDYAKNKGPHPDPIGSFLSYLL